MLFGEREKAENLYGADRAEQEVKNTLASKYGWYLIIFNLAGEDVLKIQEIVLRPVNEIFNFLALSSEINQERERAERFRGK